MISIREEDLKEIPIMYAIVNEQIKAKFDRSDLKVFSDTGEDVSDYKIRLIYLHIKPMLLRNRAVPAGPLYFGGASSRKWAGPRRSGKRV